MRYIEMILYLYTVTNRKGQALELEYGLIKCIKVLVNARVG